MRIMVKPTVFLGDSRKRIRDFPEGAKAVAGRELYRVQCGLDPADWKAMNTVGIGVSEIRVHEAGQFRVMYVAKFAEAIYVLHAFQKKTAETPKRDIDLARRRFNALAKERTSE
jgi:phage-related protein